MSATFSSAWLAASPADPVGASVLVAAVSWLEQTLLGTLATTVAVIAVATVGLMMLSGRLDIRRGATVIFGCFIVFGASTIAAGIRSVAGGGDSSATAYPSNPPPAAPLLPPPARESGNPDPYAGAAVPGR